MANHDDSPMRRLTPRQRRELDHLQQMGDLLETEPPLPLEDRDDGPPALEWSPPAFPLSVLPGTIREFAQDVARTVTSTADAVAAGILAAASAALGSARSFSVNGDFVNYGSLYLLVSGDSGSGKSPALKFAFAPVEELDLALVRDYQQAKLDYAKARKEYEKLLAAWKRADGHASVPIEPVKPPQPRILMSDLTLAVLARAMRDSPRGICLRYDELGGWLKDMNRYSDGRGSDRERYLEAWSYSMLKVSRRGTDDDGDLVVEKPFLSIVGNVVPSTLTDLVAETWKSDEGLLNRFLVCTLKRIPANPEIEPPVRRELVEHYRETIHRLRKSVHMPGAVVEREGSTPHAELPPSTTTDGLLALDPEAFEVYREFRRQHAAELNDPDFDESLRNAWMKFLSHWERLCLVLYALRWASDEPLYDGAEKTIRQLDPDFVGPIDAETTRRTTELVNFFKATARHVRGVAAVDKSEVVLSKVTAWLRKRPDTAIAPRDLARQFSTDKELNTSDKAVVILETLVGRGIVSRQPPTPGKRTARYVLIGEV